MTAREFLTNVAIILAVMAVGSALETVAPMYAELRRAPGRRHANVAFTALSFVSNWVLASIAAIAALSWRPTGLIAHYGLTGSAAIIAGIVVLDCAIGYSSHRAMHMSAPIWRFHQIHHNDPFVD